MLRTAIAGLALAAASVFTVVVTGVVASGPAAAQWGWFDNDPYPSRGPLYKRPNGDGFWGDEPRLPRPVVPHSPSHSTWSGGPRPAIAPIAPGRIAFPS